VPGIDPATGRALSHRLAVEQSERRLPSVAAGLVRGGDLVWSDAVGTLDGRSEGAASTVQTQYRIGSITKTFVAVEVLRIRDEGLLDLNDTLRHHMNDTSIDGTAIGDITIAQLLSHTSGLQSETSGPWWERIGGGTWAELMASKPSLKFRPGAKFHYSNVGYAVLGELVGRLRGLPWDDVVRRNLLEPLGMQRTTARPQDPAAGGLGVHPLADLLHVEPEHDGVAMAPAGQLWSTVSDLARWAAFLAGETGDLLSRHTLEEMRSPIALDDKAGAPWTGAYGLGCELWNVDGVRYAGHGGSMPGFLAGLRVNVETGDGCVVFANATSGMMGTVSTDLMSILAEREPITPKPWSADPGQVSVLELTGDWYWGPAAFIMSATRDGHLVLGEPGTGRGCRLKPAAGGWTGLDGYYAGEALIVVRDDQGQVSHLDLGSFRFSRTPYDPTADIPGGVDPAGWH